VLSYSTKQENLPVGQLPLGQTKKIKLGLHFTDGTKEGQWFLKTAK
jgi:hypothetical protein